MDEIIASAKLADGRSLHIATLARQTIIEAGAEHLGFLGYFLFETNDRPGEKGINVLGKVTSLEAAFRLIDIWRIHTKGDNRMPAAVFPLREFVIDECDARGWSRADLAQAMDYSLSSVNELIAGKTQITPQDASALSRAFGDGDPLYWMRLTRG